MRTTPLGALLLTFCAALVLASVLFMSVSLMVATAATLTLVLYARVRFLAELRRTSYAVEREVLDKMVFAGESTAVKVNVVNRADRPLRARFEDILPDGCELKGGSAAADLAIPPSSGLSFVYSFAADGRGALLFDAVKVLRAEPFGLFEHEETADVASAVNVHTRRRSFEVARRMAGREHLEYAGFTKSPAIVLQEFEFDGLRDYDFGDRARDIHWKSSSRLNRLMTKVYRKEGAMQAMMLVDCSSSMRLSQGPVSKIDHAVDLAMQISNVLLSNMHSSGVSLFDESRVIDETLPALGRRQFERIVAALGNAPGPLDAPAAAAAQEGPRLNGATNGLAAEDERDRAFLSAVGSLKARRAGGRPAKLGLEGEIARVAATKRSQQKLFVVLTDLVSSRNAVLAGAKLCKRTNNKMLVINTHSDWYSPAEDDEVARYERMYTSLSDSRAMEKVLRRQGTSFLRIGPADTAPRIVRTIRRGLA